jgi:beta-glucosidase
MLPSAMTKPLPAILAAATLCAAARPSARASASAEPQLESRGVPLLTVDGQRFRDLDRSGRLDPYEDWRLPAERRVADLLGRMTLEEKAGVMMHGTAPSPRGPGATAYDLAAAEKIILGARVNSLITRLGGEPRALAEQNNALQEIGERSRLGIPLTISTDPRNHFQHTLGISVAAGGFSQWPETLGLAAVRDQALVRRFAEIARQEYRAVGITMALSPQADLATEPRWPRIAGTFGEDPDLARDLVQAYVEGFQAGPAGIGPDSVVAVVKHWVGYGAAVDGWDGHNYYGRFCRLGGAFDLHVRPFEGAFAAKVGGVMPTYTILEDVSVGGKLLAPVGGAFNRTLLTDLLRGRHRFDGVVLSDWGITRDCGENCRTGAAPHTPADIAMPWGVESLSVTERFAKGVAAGLDQFGGTEESSRLVEAVRSGLVAETRLDESVRRILVQKFQLGLFERPFVDPVRAADVVGSSAFRAEALAAQRRSLVLLENRGETLPLRAGARVFLYGLDAAAVRASGLEPVDRLDDAQVAVLRVSAPFEKPHPNFFFGRMHHEGRLDFRDGDKDYQQLKAAAARVPTVVAVYLDRPAILANVRDKASAIIANFGASDAALLEVLTGRARAEGRLPFELPSSMAEVEAQAPGRPHDTRRPLYPIGAGSASRR